MKKHDKYKNLLAYLVFAFMIVSLGSIAIAINTSTTGYRVNTNNDIIDYAGSTCDILRKSSGNDFFVPTKTTAETNAFRANKPGNAVTTSCVINNSTDFHVRCDSCCSGVSNGQYTYANSTVVAPVAGNYKVEIRADYDSYQTYERVIYRMNNTGSWLHLYDYGAGDNVWRTLYASKYLAKGTQTLNVRHTYAVGSSQCGGWPGNPQSTNFKDFRITALN